MPSIEPIPLQGASSLLWNDYKPACNSWSFIGRMLSVVADAAQSFGALQHPLRTPSSSSIILSRCRPRSDCSVSSLTLSLSCGCRMYMGGKYRVKYSVRRYCTVSVEIVWIATGSRSDGNDVVAYEHFSREVTEFGPSRAKSLPSNLGPVQAHRRVI